MVHTSECPPLADDPRVMNACWSQQNSMEFGVCCPVKALLQAAVPPAWDEVSGSQSDAELVQYNASRTHEHICHFINDPTPPSYQCRTVVATTQHETHLEFVMNLHSRIGGHLSSHVRMAAKGGPALGSFHFRAMFTKRSRSKQTER